MRDVFHLTRLPLKTTDEEGVLGSLTVRQVGVRALGSEGPRWKLPRLTELFLGSIIAISSIGCDGSKKTETRADAECALGTERCDCRPDGSCDEELECVSNLCVGPRPDDSDDATEDRDASEADDEPDDAVDSDDASNDDASNDDVGDDEADDSSSDDSSNDTTAADEIDRDDDTSDGEDATDEDAADDLTSDDDSVSDDSNPNDTTEDNDCMSGGDSLRLEMVVRDFLADEPGFELFFECGDDGVPGMVETRLSAQGKPVLAVEDTDCGAGTSTIEPWFAERDATFVKELVLYADGAGGFVNRWGPNGDRWSRLPESGEATFCDFDDAQCDACTIATNDVCFYPCPDAPLAGYSCVSPEQLIDGTPLFFPIDAEAGVLGSVPLAAAIPAEVYGYDGWPDEELILPGAPLHNFHFTTEIRHDFEYSTDVEATVTITGDDDIWVFINEQLVIDLGGRHVPTSGSFTLTAQAASDLSLVDGERYELAIFQVERQSPGSSLMLSLFGFDSCAE